MNAIAWLRKLGYGSTGLRFRNEFINLEALEGLKPLDRVEAPEPRRRLNGIAASTEREERCPGGLAGPWEDSGRVAAARAWPLKPLVRVGTTPERARSAPFVGTRGGVSRLAARLADGGRRARTGRAALGRGGHG